ncbi:MAG: NAD(P)H-dependent oxidoreductase subunit E [Akkermansia sp.]|nr:NAD(P)H-dependent oxidoreductase subunit E [Akkermansia sp.]
MSNSSENVIEATIAHQPSPGEKYYPAFEVTAELDAKAAELITHYPEGKQQSAVLPILHVIQKQFGYISGEAIAWVGEKLNVSAAHVLGVVTFYPGLRQMCPGKFHIRVCRTLSCAMAGADNLFDKVCTRLNIDKSAIDHHHPIGVSPDGLWSIEGVECLANCGFGPNMMVNDVLYQQVSDEVLEEVIAKCLNA